MVMTLLINSSVGEVPCLMLTVWERVKSTKFVEEYGNKDQSESEWQCVVHKALYVDVQWAMYRIKRTSLWNVIRARTRYKGG
jgi:hypothetical protein